MTAQLPIVESGETGAAGGGPDAPRGVYAACVTPLTEALEPDPGAFVTHCRWLLGNGCDGLSMLGTTGEANSLSAAQRRALLDEAVAAGLPAERMIPGTGACALADAVTLSAAAVALGCGGVLTLPPFYYKEPGEDGLFGFFAELIERVGDSRLRLYLYHFPQMSAVPITPSLIARLMAAYPSVVAGLKDSSGDWSYTEALLREFPGFRAFSGSERFLLDNLKHGGAGCISATTNITAPLAHEVMRGWQSPDAEALQERLTAARLAIQKYPLVAAVKALKARMTGDPGWRHILPPLMPLTGGQEADLLADIAGVPGFDAVGAGG